MQIHWKFLISVFLVAQAAIGNDAVTHNSATPANTPERTAPADQGLGTQTPARVKASPAAGRADELQKIVVLCATRPDSDEFRHAWSVYVLQYHQPDAVLDRTIDDILARASAYRQSRHAATGKLTWAATERQAVHKIMFDTAKAALQHAG